MRLWHIVRLYPPLPNDASRIVKLPGYICGLTYRIHAVTVSVVASLKH